MILLLLLLQTVPQEKKLCPCFPEKLCPCPEDRALPPQLDDPEGRAPHDPAAEAMPADPSLPAPKEEGPSIRVLVGGVTGLMTEKEEFKVEPFARIDVEWEMTDTDRPVVANVSADLTALPGEAIDLTDPVSFRALEFSLGIGWQPSVRIYASGYCEAGFATRIVTRDQEPLYEAPKWGGCGARFSSKPRNAFLVAMIAADQRLDGEYRAAVIVSGGVDITPPLAGSVALSMVVDAVLGLSHSTGLPRRDIVRAGVSLAWGGK